MTRPRDNTITMETFTEGLWKDNPVFVMLLGMCPVLAVSNTAINSLAMGVATTFVLLASSLMVSLFSSYIPKQVRIATYIVIIATFVTIVDYVIQAISLDLYNALGAFIQLIVANCIILGRAEAYASKYKPAKALTNGLGMGVGFTLALMSLGIVREILGAGTLFGIQLFSDNFQPWVVMVLPAGGFLVLGAWLLVFDWINERQQQMEADQGQTHAG